MRVWFLILGLVLLVGCSSSDAGLVDDLRGGCESCKLSCPGYDWMTNNYDDLVSARNMTRADWDLTPRKEYTACYNRECSSLCANAGGY